MKFELKKLMLEERFGSIRLGDSPQKVARLLGLPKDYHVEDRSLERRHILKNSSELKVLAFRYGSIEFWFSFGKLTFLYSDHFDQDLEFRSEIYFDPWVFQRGLCIKDFLRLLEQENIKYTIFQNTMVNLEDGFAYQIYFGKNTYVIFSSEITISRGYDGKKWNETIVKPPCAEIRAFYLVAEDRKIEELSYLKQIHNIEELLL